MTLFEQKFQKYEWVTLEYSANLGIKFLRNNPTFFIPNSYGTYVIRAPRSLNRVQLCSDVIYVGQSGGTAGRGSQGIHYRLFAPRGVDEEIRLKIEALFPNQAFRLQYCVTAPNGELAKQIEGELLEAYLLTHFELPPANHQCPKNFKFG